MRRSVPRTISDSSTKPTAKAASAAAQPSRWPQRSVRRPLSSSINAPAAGRATSSQVYAVMVSALEEVGFVDRSRPAGTENRHDDGQPDNDFAGGDHHREERHHLPVETAMHPGVGDERQVDGVEHQLDAHEHHDRVAPQEHTGRADGEQQRRKIQVVGGIHLSPSCSEPLPTVRCCRIGGTESFEYDPSGSRAAMSTALWRAYTPGPGSGVGYPPLRKRSIDNSRWVFRRSNRSRWASTIAPTAAVISSALVSSNAHR